MTGQLALPEPAATAWFAHWFCHCSQLAAHPADCTPTCPTHHRAQMQAPELVDIDPERAAWGLHPNLTRSDL